MKKILIIALYLLGLTSTLFAEEVGSVSTEFKLLGANHKIVIESFDDPKVIGVSCFVARAKTGGITGSIGIAEDPSEMSISCEKTSSIISLDESVKNKKRDGEEVFKESSSFWFKKVKVVRFYNNKRNTLIYLTYSDKLIDGSPKNSISTIKVD